MEGYKEPVLLEQATPEQKQAFQEEKAKIKRLRHGPGAQIFYRPDNSVMCKYEGHWDRDLKHGKGILTYPDQSVYVGELKKGIKHGKGRYVWSNGDSFDGRWKMNKMEGPGVFRRSGDVPFEGNLFLSQPYL